MLFAAWSTAVAEISSADHTWPGNILDLARAAGCTKFAQLAEDNGLGDMLRDQGDHFQPINARSSSERPKAAS